jgi:hypothetical protein
MPKWVDEGEHRTLDILFGSQPVDANVYLGLYTNNTEPVEGANLAAINEPVGFAYSRKAMARGAWVITDDHADFAQQLFTATGGAWGNVYGYFIATSLDGSGKLLCVEHFSNGPYNVQDGGTVKVTPKITCS